MKKMKNTAVFVLSFLFAANLFAQSFDNLNINSFNFDDSPPYADFETQYAPSLSPFPDFSTDGDLFPENDRLNTKNLNSFDLGGRPGQDEGIGQVGDLSIRNGIDFLLVAASLYVGFIFCKRTKKHK